MRSNYKMDALIEEFINSDRDREILRHRFIDGWTISRIAEDLKMSDVQIGRIVRDKGNPLLLMLEDDNVKKAIRRAIWRGIAKLIYKR